MNMTIVLGLLVLAAIGVLMVKFTSSDGTVKLSFVPEIGTKSNYFDCDAIDINGRRWKSVEGIWTNR